MAIITGVKFRTPGKVYYFAPGELPIRYGDHVIVETARGLEYGKVVLPIREVPDEDITQPLKEVIRIATTEDAEHEDENREKEEKAYRVCQEKIREHNLDMKLVLAEYTFDNAKLTFYFTADGRVDFRELVKDLAGIFRTRIELRQIGVRDETKILGGIGICGRPLCCHAYLHEFAPVSIKMAKEQNLSLNPTKISGSCGRLMCCLKNEAETYEYLNRGLPRKGDEATTPDGLSAQVQSVNILRQTVRVIVDLENDEKEMREYPVSEIHFFSKKGRHSVENDLEAAPEDAGDAEERLSAGAQDESAEELRREALTEVPREGRNPSDRRNGRDRQGMKERRNRTENRETGTDLAKGTVEEEEEIWSAVAEDFEPAEEDTARQQGEGAQKNTRGSKTQRRNDRYGKKNNSAKKQKASGNGKSKSTGTPEDSVQETRTGNGEGACAQAENGEETGTGNSSKKPNKDKHRRRYHHPKKKPSSDGNAS